MQANIHPCFRINPPIKSIKFIEPSFYGIIFFEEIWSIVTFEQPNQRLFLNIRLLLYLSLNFWISFS